MRRELVWNLLQKIPSEQVAEVLIKDGVRSTFQLLCLPGPETLFEKAEKWLGTYAYSVAGKYCMCMVKSCEWPNYAGLFQKGHLNLAPLLRKLVMKCHSVQWLGMYIMLTKSAFHDS